MVRHVHFFSLKKILRLHQLFIIIPILGVIYVIVRFPETKGELIHQASTTTLKFLGLPLEEVARLFGDDHEVMVWSDNIVIDHDHHELVFNEPEGKQVKQQAQSYGEVEEEKTAKTTSVSHVEGS